MKNLFFVLSIVAAFAVACQPKKTDTVSLTPTLTLKWETDTLLTTCESVIYDSVNNVLYVANINGQPTGKDGNGFISQVSLDGKITNLKWATGMDAPKGMGLFNGKLYVADINRIHEIEIASGKITNTYMVDSAKFLNDITVDATGKVYVSDTGAGNIVVLDNGKISVWLTGVAGVNGLLAEGNNMQMVSFATGVFSTVDASKQITMRADSIDNGDGVEAVGNGAYLVSSWNGMVHYVGADGKPIKLLDTKDDKINAADIEYIASKKLLLVPTFFKNKVRAYELTM